MLTDPQAPWMFRRDEVDLLEEDIDEIYNTHQSANGRVKTMEQAVILEQLDTEEQADAEFAQQMDLKWLTKSSAEKPNWENRNERLNEEQDLTCDVQRPPFYEQLFHFAERVFVHATEVYGRGGNSKEYAFRVLVNVKMVPIKCAIALSEEMHDDEMSLALAKKEYGLSLVYLDRILISLAFLAADGDEHAQSFLSPGTQIKQILQKQLSRLSGNSRGFSRRYE